MFYNYNPKQILPSFGPHIIDGTADGTSIVVATEEDAATHLVGGGGDVVRVESNNNVGVITITLHQSSPSNTALSLLMETQTLNGKGVYPFFLKDLNGATQAGGRHAWVQKKPDSPFGDSVESREWIIIVAEMDYVAGGATS